MTDLVTYPIQAYRARPQQPDLLETALGLLLGTLAVAALYAVQAVP